MASNSLLASDVDLAELAALTRNFSGAELEGLIRAATAAALGRNVDPSHRHGAVDVRLIQVG
jgi:vesicle-fusing ATPase